MHKIVIFTCILASYLQIMKRNVPILGFVLGVIMPLIGITLFALVGSRGSSMGAFIQDMAHNPRVASKVITLSLILNLIPFIYYTNKRLDYTARGILIATMLYALFIVWIMFVM